MASAARLVVNLTARTTEFERSMIALERALDRSVRHVEQVGKTLSASLTAPLLAIGGLSARASAQFDDSMQRLSSAAGLGAAEVSRLKEGVLALAGPVAQAPKDLGRALEGIVAAGVKGAAALDVLKIASMGAAVNLGNTETIARVVTGAINAYGTANLSAARAAGILMAVQREGNISAEDLAATMGRTAPLASQLGVSFDQVGAAMALMSRSGLEAGQAAAALQTFFATLLRPTAAAQAALANVGLTAEGMRRQLGQEGLLPVLQTLQERFLGNDDALTQLFPSARTLGGVLTLLGNDGRTAADVFGSLARVTDKDLGGAFERAAADPGFKFQQAMARIDVLLTRLGDQILPPLVPILEAFSNRLGQAADWVARLEPGTRNIIVVFGGLAAAAGPALLAFAGMVHGISSVISAFRLLYATGVLVSVGLPAAFAKAGPFLLAQLARIGAGLTAFSMVLSGPVIFAAGLLAIAAILISTQWDELRRDLGYIADWVAEKFRGTFVEKLVGYIAQFARSAADLLRKFGIELKTTLVEVWEETGGAAIDGLTNVVTSGFDGLIKQAEQFANDFVGKLGGMGGAGAMPSFGGGSFPAPPAPPGEGEASAWDAFFEVTEQRAGAVRQKLIDLGLAAQTTTAQFRTSVQSMGQETARTMGAMTAAFVAGKQSFGDYVRDMVRMIQQLIIKIMVLKALTAAGMGGGFATGFVGAMPMLGGFADGGRPPVGEPSWVGEDGPEIFVPDVAGTIVPNDRLGGGGATQITIEQNVQITGMDLTSTEAARKLLRTMAAETRAGAAEAVAFAKAANDQASTQSRRSYGG